MSSGEPRQLAPWASRPAVGKRGNGRRGSFFAGGLRDLNKLSAVSRWSDPGQPESEQTHQLPSGGAPSGRPQPGTVPARLAAAVDANPLAAAPVGHRGMSIVPTPAALPAVLGERAVVLAANHSTAADYALLLSQLPVQRRRRTVLVCAHGDRISPALTVRFPVIRVDFDAPGAAGVRVVRRLQRGWTAIVFAEGKPSRDGSLGEFASLPAELARRAGVPLLPAAIRGAFAADNNRAYGRKGRSRVAVRFGELIEPQAGQGDIDQPTDQLRRAVEALLAEDTTSWWQARRRVTEAEPGRVHGVGGQKPADDSDDELWRRVWEHTAAPVPGGAGETRRIWR